MSPIYAGKQIDETAESAKVPKANDVIASSSKWEWSRRVKRVTW